METVKWLSHAILDRPGGRLPEGRPQGLPQGRPEGRPEGRPGSRSGLTADRRGVAALEFALLSAPMLIMLFSFVAVNLMLYSWSAMQTSSQNAATVFATVSPTSTAGTIGTTVNCSSSPASTTVEYYACQNLPSWTTFSVVLARTCSAVATVPSTVSVTVSAANMSGAAMVDTYSLFSGKSLVASTTMVKQGTCP